MVNDIVSHLEMTSPRQLRAVPTSNPPVTLRPVRDTEVELIRTMHDQVAGPFGWESLTWSFTEWATFLGRDGVRTWIPEVAGRPAGVVSVQAQPGGHVEIEFFGLTPEFTGRGLGGRLLTVTTEQAWTMPALAADLAVTRVWLRTSSHDHPHALGCYQSRGYRVFHVEHRRRELIVPTSL